ncbi:MAG: hypothetical protein R3F43_00045 [bacterium]
MESLMALWHFDCVAIPVSSSDAVKGIQLSELSDEVWQGAAVDAASAILATLGPSHKGWCEDLNVWGNEDKTCVLMMADGASMVELRLRIDARDVDAELLQKFLAISERQGWSLLTEDGEVVAPAMMSLLDAVRRSRAAEYSRDAEGYFRRLPRKNIP